MRAGRKLRMDFSSGEWAFRGTWRGAPPVCRKILKQKAAGRTRGTPSTNTRVTTLSYPYQKEKSMNVGAFPVMMRIARWATAVAVASLAAASVPALAQEDLPG